MGFWDGMMKMVQGKPLFDNSTNAQPAEQEEHFEEKPVKLDTGHTPLDGNGQKIIPEFEIEHLNNHLSGNHLEVWITFHNTSQIRLFIDKILIFGQKMELNYDLAPGAARQMMVYRGNTLTNDHYGYADVDYRVVQTGDYFQARYMVVYEVGSDGTYVPHGFKMQHPVKDI